MAQMLKSEAYGCYQIIQMYEFSWLWTTFHRFTTFMYTYMDSWFHHLYPNLFLSSSKVKDLLEYAAMHFNNNQQSSSIYKSLLLLPFAKCKFGQTSSRERESSRKHRAQKAWTLPVRSGYYDVDSVKQQVIGPIFILLIRFK